jgi:basic membrane lipoprotein Med (substrate-binding protein (PBP1-ABC) superfamily)
MPTSPSVAARRRVLAPAGLAAALTLLSACKPASASRDEGAGAKTFSVALLLAGPENDEGWNQSAFEGLQRIEKELGARVRKVGARNASEIEQAMTQAAQQHFDLVYGHGSEFNEPAARVAAQWPEVKFATSGGTKSGDNLAIVEPRTFEAGYALGVLAAHLTKSKVVSSLHGEKYESVQRAAAAFAAGARSVKPDVKILEDYLGSWEDVALAKEKALSHAAAGADVFFQNCDAAAAGIFEACRQKGVLAFGCNGDQAAKAPDVVVASAVSDIPKILVGLAAEVKEHRFAGGARSFGMKEQEVRVVFNEALRAKVPAAARTAVEAACAAIARGELKP